MNTRTLTSANSVIMLTIAGLYGAPQLLQGYSAEDITDTDAVTPGQTAMGLDGRLSAGFVPFPTRQNITLQGDSLSLDLFENWLEAEKTAREKYIAAGTLLIPATQRRYAMTRGFLVSATQTPSLRNIVQPRRFTIEWQDVSPAPLL